MIVNGKDFSENFRGHAGCFKDLLPMGRELECLTHSWHTVGTLWAELEAKIACQIPIILPRGAKEPILFIQQSKLLRRPR